MDNRDQREYSPEPPNPTDSSNHFMRDWKLKLSTACTGVAGSLLGFATVGNAITGNTGMAVVDGISTALLLGTAVLTGREVHNRNNQS